MVTPSPSVERSTAARQPPGGVRSGTSFAIAIGLHVAIFLMIPEFRAGLRRVVAIADADLVEVEPVPEPAAPPPPPPPPPERVERPLPPPDPNEPTPEAPPLADQAAEPPPEVLALDEVLSNSGFTMTNAPNATPTGPAQSGELTGRNTQGAAVGSPEGVPGGTGPVSDADLSVRAAPVRSLDAILDQHYPALAQQQGIEGDGRVNVEVLADGSLGRITRRGESISGYGFAQACIATVREGGPWTPARDRNGQAVTSVRPFTCSFEIRH